MRSDSEIRVAVERDLQRAPDIDDSFIAVIVQSRVVTLIGEAAHYGAKWAAEDVAKRVLGVRAIANEIQVRLRERTAPSDTAIAQAVANTLSSVLAAASHIQCVVQNGIVVLSGDVPTGDQKSAAESAVSRLVGVKGVLNSIMTTGPA